MARLFESAEDIQAAEREAMLGEAVGRARLPAGRSGVVGGSMAGGLLGRAIQKSMGTHAPTNKAAQMEEAKAATDAEAKEMGIDPSNPKYFDVAAKNLHAVGLTEQAMMAIEAKNEFRKANADIENIEADTKGKSAKTKQLQELTKFIEPEFKLKETATLAEIQDRKDHLDVARAELEQRKKTELTAEQKVLMKQLERNLTAQELEVKSRYNDYLYDKLDMDLEIAKIKAAARSKELDDLTKIDLGVAKTQFEVWSKEQGMRGLADKDWLWTGMSKEEQDDWVVQSAALAKEIQRKGLEEGVYINQTDAINRAFDIMASDRANAAQGSAEGAPKGWEEEWPVMTEEEKQMVLDAQKK